MTPDLGYDYYKERGLKDHKWDGKNTQTHRIGLVFVPGTKSEIICWASILVQPERGARKG